MKSPKDFLPEEDSAMEKDDNNLDDQETTSRGRSNRPSNRSESRPRRPSSNSDIYEHDYQNRHRGESIWNQRERFYEQYRQDRTERQAPPPEEEAPAQDRSEEENRTEDEYQSSGRTNYRPRGYRGAPRRPMHPGNRPGSRPHYHDENEQEGDSNSESNSRYRPRRPRGYYDQDANLEPKSGARGRRGEPITLAEQLALEKTHPSLKDESSDSEPPVEKPNKEKETYIAELSKLSMAELIAEARKEDLTTIDGEPQNDLIFRIMQKRIRNSGLMFGEGTLEILPDEFGFLRSSEYHYLSCPDDIYVSPSQIRRFGLRNGLTISGQIRPPKERERYFALLRIEAINHEDPNKLLEKPLFDELTAMHPNERIIMETSERDTSMRVQDLIVPVGFGQRGLIVSPPRAGKTILMQKMARAVLTNYPNSHVFMLLIDERPEEVTDMEREVKGPHCEIVSSTFDEPASRHIQVSEMVLEKAKRMVEYGKDVVIFLDSITRLARAWNSECPDSGKTLTGGVDANALQRPKKFFGSARKVEQGGSLTILATALIGTGSRMDEVIFEEFKGTGNLEIRLDRALVDQRIWPAIDISQSGTRREEMILDPEEHERMTFLRKSLLQTNPIDAMKDLTERLEKTKTNAEFLMGLRID